MVKSLNRHVLFEKSPKGIKAVIQSVPKPPANDFDKGFPDGIFVVPKHPQSPSYNVRALDKYCSERGITVSQLTPEELSSFEISR
jgi:selenophosphate synthetase-related protein